MSKSDSIEISESGKGTPDNVHVPIQKYWYENNPYTTVVFNALSVSIPEIERFIVRATRDALPHVKDKHLQKAVEILTHEEEAHARVHDAYNMLLRKQGYKIETHEALEHAIANFFDTQGIKMRLVVCLCSEFFTAVMGRFMLEKKLFAAPNSDERMCALWTWHSLEELHHRGTAFDLYLDYGGGYFLRTGMMLVLTARWITTYFSIMLSLLFQNKVKLNVQQLGHALAFTIGREGFYMNVAANWFGFFKPGFHPRKDIVLQEGVDPELHHYHAEKHFVEIVERS